VHKKYSHHFKTLKLSHCSYVNCFKYIFSSFLGIESVNCFAGNADLTEPSDFMKNILICVLKMNEGLIGVERQKSE